MKLWAKIVLPVLAQYAKMNIQLTVSIQELNYLLVAAQELPGKICNPLSEKLRAQAKAQLEPQTNEANVIEANSAS